MAVSQDQIEKIVTLAKSYGATRLILFGSSQERSRKARDVDLACDGVQEWKLYELAARIEEELDTSLDLVLLTPQTRFAKLAEAKGRVLI